ncbi:hypothetical protein ACTQ5F_06450 [Jeotgalibaca porci]|uniref:hypothetical protein n=1 Tax=Jeotgalibaca porci TaxID=1868793 RepID=UPI003F93AEE9
MFEVNFFEKKQNNYLPHLLGALTVIILIGIGLYFFTTHSYLVRKEEENQRWLVNEADQIAVSRQIKNYEVTTAQLTEDKAVFTEMAYPIAAAADAITTLVPGGAAKIASFNLLVDNQVTLVLEDVSITEIDKTVQDFRDQEYVTQAQLIRVESEIADAGSLAEIWITLDESVLKGEAVQ